MMFGRRAPLGWWDRFRRNIWPPGGWRRTISYHGHRLARMRASPHAVAAGLACGVAIGVTPLLGLQLLLAAALALIMRGSVLASVAGTFVANPWTVPIIWLATFRLGSWMLFGDATAVAENGISDALVDIGEAVRARDYDRLEAELWPILFCMLVGSLPLGAAAWCLTYWPARRLVRRYRARRRWGRRQVGVFAANRAARADSGPGNS